MSVKFKNLFERRKRRNRFNLKNKKSNHHRLSVFRSSKNIYAQIIDDQKGHTIVSASSIEKSMKSIKSGGNIEAAKKIGFIVAERAVKKGVSVIIFDRGGYKYHGRVKALAESARSAGLKF